MDIKKVYDNVSLQMDATSIPSLTADVESLDKETRVKTVASFDKVKKTLKKSLNIDSEGYSHFDDVVSKSLELVASLENRENISFRAPDVSVESIARPAELYGSVKTIDFAEAKAMIDTESFDGQTLDITKKFTLATNIAKAKQSKAAELLFPTIVIGPYDLGVSVTSTVVSVYNGYVKGGISKYKETNLIDLARKGGLITQFTKLTPVKSDENAEYLVTDVEEVENREGETYVKSPLKVGVKVPFLEVSQTAKDLAKGEVDQTDAIDKRVAVESLIVKVEGNDGKVAYVKVNQESLISAIGQPSQIDSTEEFYFNYTAKNVVLSKNSQVVSGDTTALNDVFGDNIVTAAVIVNGNGRINHGAEMYLSVSGLDVLKVKDVNGNLVAPDSATFADVVSSVKTKVKVVGWYPNARHSNANLVKGSKLGRIESFVDFIEVPFVEGTAIEKAVVKQGLNGDIDHLNSILQITGFTADELAVDTIINYSGIVKQHIDAGGDIEDINSIGVARRNVNPYIEVLTGADALNIKEIVDSAKSSEKAEDIASAIGLWIKNKAEDMLLYSNYRTFKAAVDKTDVNDAKVSIAVVCGTNLRKIMDNVEVPGVDVHVEYFELEKFDNKIVIAPVDMRPERNKQILGTNFGNMVYRPTITAKVNVMVNNRVKEVYRDFNSMIHVVNLPIMVLAEVKGVDAVLTEKSIGYRKSI